MNLSEDNRKYAQRLIGQLEKDACFWRWGRWLLLTVAVLYLAVLLGADRWLSHKFAAAHEEAGLHRPNAAATVADVEREIDYHVNVLRAERIHHNGVMLNMLVLLFLLGYTIGQWNRHKRYALIAALLGEHLGEAVDTERIKPADPPL